MITIIWFFQKIRASNAPHEVHLSQLSEMTGIYPEAKYKKNATVRSFGKETLEFQVSRRIHSLYVSPFKITRRELLAASAGTAALGSTLLACDSSEPEPTGPKVAPPEPPPEDNASESELRPEDVSLDEEIFPLGVQAGAMTSTSAILWTYASDTQAKELIVWRPSTNPDSILIAHRSTLQAVDGYIKTRVSGLGSGHYQYAFFDSSSGQLSARSTIGAFRTAFREGDLRPLTIAGLTCSSMRNAPFRSLNVSADFGADVYCHMGDMSYNDAARNQEEYRRHWTETLAEAGYRKALPKAGMYNTWDDHEIDNNFDPERMAAEDPEKLRAAKDAYFEHLPNDRGENDRLWHSYRWGATAEFFILDSRSERKPSTRLTEKPVYISEEQMAWLKAGLKASPCKYKVLLNSVPMTKMLGVWEAANDDRWQGYEIQRQELLDFMFDNQIRGVLFLSGDFHFGYIAKVDPLGPASKYLEIAVGPTANGPNPLAVLAETGDLSADDLFPPNQFIHFSGSWSASTLIELDPLNERIRVKHVDSREGKEDEILFDGELEF